MVLSGGKVDWEYASPRPQTPTLNGRYRFYAKDGRITTTVDSSVCSRSDQGRAAKTD